MCVSCLYMYVCECRCRCDIVHMLRSENSSGVGPHLLPCLRRGLSLYHASCLVVGTLGFQVHTIVLSFQLRSLHWPDKHLSHQVFSQAPHYPTPF